ncbi:DUF6243 family protein [Streptomyces sp. NBC_00859]|uniref:DUF6243 family protein n=1 Tax=Streptomyces sp. NBC_00859 TaxID=2903682 RepID=UPI003867B125|nr:DUF6243 family protein [Streptomyces sp. NBC_00859]
MAKSRNNLLGVGGQRKKMPRSGAQSSAAAGAEDRRSAADQKHELLQKMRERAEGAGVTEGPEAQG